MHTGRSYENRRNTPDHLASVAGNAPLVNRLALNFYWLPQCYRLFIVGFLPM
jgi:hypothetical protein